MHTGFDPLARIPAVHSPDALASWLENTATRLNALPPDRLDPGQVASCTGQEAAIRDFFPGQNAAETFTLAVLLADWACYAEKEKREEPAHIDNIFSVFPHGLRLWTVKLQDKPIPIGYTCFHPISRDLFHRLQNAPERITNRKQISPEKESSDGENALYIHNISIIKQFHRTQTSKNLVKALAQDIASVAHCALAAIVVSPDGQRLAARFGMHPSGFISHDGHKEMAFVSPGASAPPAP
jgi:hypothetical protein